MWAALPCPQAHIILLQHAQNLLGLFICFPLLLLYVDDMGWGKVRHVHRLIPAA